ncbi:hypothetical protein [Pleionea litopenaei]|uniref:Uncharacterized protein n=1 Tax=Pleionea litopenaei TaxID=3070815 RepID=A0AA51RTD7_9GAMM|nr:hypothetical protein [Pleionea sp. HL-JVS1]WMS87240.1 hypothetical protein Q9312_18705 [Pleionea sp. HL-JVS1]
MRVLVSILLMPTLTFGVDLKDLTIDNIADYENPYEKARLASNGSDHEVVLNHVHFSECRGAVIGGLGRLWSMQQASKRGESKKEIMNYHLKDFEDRTKKELEEVGQLKAQYEVVKLAYEYKDNQEEFPRVAMAMCLKINKELF